jgi:hypothetical protein
MAIRNKRSRVDAMLLRSMIYPILQERTLLEPLSNKQIREKLNNGASVAAIQRARLWLEKAWKEDQLAELMTWLRRARQGDID